jgi:molybdopterin converting factor small subunit
LAKVLLASPLQNLTGNRAELEASGPTVEEVIRELVEEYPDLKKKLLTPDGTLSYSVMIYLDGKDIKSAGREKAPVGERSVIKIFPVVGGG